MPVKNQVAIQIPRGLKFAGSPKLAGALPRTRVRVPVKTYRVDVEPNGWQLKPKVAARLGARSPSWASLSESETIEDDNISHQGDDKRKPCAFRFPPLVCPRSKQNAQMRNGGEVDPDHTEETADAPAGNDRSTSSLLWRTRSAKAKMRPKVKLSSARPWHATGSGAAEGLINGHPRCFLEINKNQTGAEKEISFSMGVVPATELDRRIEALRERGRNLNENLKQFYEDRRTIYQTSQGSKILSSYEAYSQDYDIKAKQSASDALRLYEHRRRVSWKEFISRKSAVRSMKPRAVNWAVELGVTRCISKQISET